MNAKVAKMQIDLQRMMDISNKRENDYFALKNEAKALSDRCNALHEKQETLQREIYVYSNNAVDRLTLLEACFNDVKRPRVEDEMKTGVFADDSDDDEDDDAEEGHFDGDNDDDNNNGEENGGEGEGSNGAMPAPKPKAAAPRPKPTTSLPRPVKAAPKPKGPPPAMVIVDEEEL